MILIMAVVPLPGAESYSGGSFIAFNQSTAEKGVQDEH
jgi:hypothetical protein